MHIIIMHKLTLPIDTMVLYLCPTLVSRAIRFFYVWRRPRILAARIVGENSFGVLRHTFRVLCWNVGSANQIVELLISRGIKM